MTRFVVGALLIEIQSKTALNQSPKNPLYGNPDHFIKVLSGKTGKSSATTRASQELSAIKIALLFPCPSAASTSGLYLNNCEIQ